MSGTGQYYGLGEGKEVNELPTVKDTKIFLGKKFKIDAAHHLENYEGKCANMHGHTWYIEIEIVAFCRDQSGIAIDFNEFTKDVNDKIIEKLDHNVINSVVENPSAENIAEWIFEKMDEDYQVSYVKVQEGEGGYAKKCQST